MLHSKKDTCLMQAWRIETISCQVHLCVLNDAEGRFLKSIKCYIYIHLFFSFSWLHTEMCYSWIINVVSWATMQEQQGI